MLQNDLIDSLLVSSDFVFLSTDNTGKILTVTPAVREVFKLQEGEVEGLGMNDLIPMLCMYPQTEFEVVQARGGLELMMDEDECAEGAEYMEFLASHTQSHGRFELESGVEKGPKWVSLVTNKLLNDDKIIYTVIIRDITQRKHDEHEILDLNQNLEARVEERTSQIKGVVMSCSAELEHVNNTYQAMKEKQMDLMESIESSVLSETVGLNEQQVSQIKNAISNELVKSMNLYSEDQITDQKFMLTMMSLNELFGGKSAEDENLQPGQLSGTSQDEVRAERKEKGIIPTYRLVDTCAAEFEAYTPYFYSTYGVENEAIDNDKKKIIILGGGPNRIGQGIEFDYCCVHASYALKELGYETIMVNSNPETVSTDYDTSDKLYFEPSGKTLIFSYQDRPGVLAELTQAIAYQGINIEDIRSPHNKDAKESIALIKVNDEVSNATISTLKEKLACTTAFYVSL